MEIILTQPVKNLGDKNDIVKVKDGYALNYLIPQKMAIPATISNKKVVAENKKQAEHKEARVKEEAQKIADKLGKITLKVSTLIGKEGKIYGAITPLQIHNYLKEKGFDIDRKNIHLNEEVKAAGAYTATVHLHKEVQATVKFEVVEKPQD